VTLATTARHVKFCRKRQPSISGDGSAISCTVVIVDVVSESWNEPAGLHTEVGTHVNQELPLPILSMMKTWHVVVVQTCPC
jgi:hypothetical protein